MSKFYDDDYREQMDKAAHEPSKEDMIPANYVSGLSVSKGFIAGMFGAVGIIVGITILSLIGGHDLWLAPRFIASIILRDLAWSSGIMGTISIIIGTIINIVVGGIYGAIFAYLIPSMPRGFWIVAGIIFSVLTWGIAVVILPIIAPENPIATLTYTNALIFAHAIYGIVLGSAGTFFGEQIPQHE